MSFGNNKSRGGRRRAEAGTQQSLLEIKGGLFLRMARPFGLQEAGVLLPDGKAAPLPEIDTWGGKRKSNLQLEPSAAAAAATK